MQLEDCFEFLAPDNIPIKGTRTGLAALTQAQLDEWALQAQTHALGGELPNYIPLLAQANPSWFATQVQSVEAQIASGDAARSFPLMSVIKPFVLLYLLEQLGMEAVFKRVGMEPSDQPFNSLAQLKADRGWPRNPLINSGAIVLASLLPGAGLSRTQGLQQWLNHYAGCQLFLDQQMLASVRSGGGKPNQAITSLLAQHGLAAPESALDTYNQVCCLSGTVEDLAHLGMLLVRGGSILSAHRRVVNALLTTCGLYQRSGRFAVQVGLPTKSGVSGALVSVVPGQGAIACYGPTLDQSGNSLAGLFLLEHLAQALNLSMFD